MMQRRYVRMACVAWVLLVMSACRAAHAPHDSELDAQPDAERVWYDADGQGGPCEPPAKACEAFDANKDFVDQCVAQGFQAKTCGCSVRCSGAINFKRSSGGAPVGHAEPRCPPQAVTEIARLLADRRSGAALDRCLASHLCEGKLGPCAEAELEISQRLRGLARGGCEDEVVGAACRDGFADSLQCPDVDITLLSETWQNFHQNDSDAKRCIRNVVCSDNQRGCSPATLERARIVKAAVNHDGCEYWLRHFCSLGAAAW